ncbi:hypothetical protein AM571_CH02755 [Rhizobium etli 8C-3]|uniref:Uncharacterized protein n=2 Tax=Rhizobium etli TaxID=29449 RepID=A0A1L5P613_RHIET|nr:hypothetical protein AM571_CH02755 [Rhizobium etli 8C-3]
MARWACALALGQMHQQRANAPGRCVDNNGFTERRSRTICSAVRPCTTAHSLHTAPGAKSRTATHAPMTARSTPSPAANGAWAWPPVLLALCQWVQRHVEAHNAIADIADYMVHPRKASFAA